MNGYDTSSGSLPSGASPIPAPGQASPDELSTGWTDESDGDN